MLNLEIGDIVKSISGRDKNNLFVVYKLEDNYAYLVDGKLRTIQNPKKKKLKHICRAGSKSETLKHKWQSGVKVLDAEIRNTINNLIIT